MEQSYMSGKKKTVIQDDACASIKSSDKGKGVCAFSQRHPESRQEVLSAKQTDVSQWPRLEQTLVHNGHISPYNIIQPKIASEIHCQNGMISSNGGKDSSSAGTLENLQPRKRLRSLVRNGGISQSENSESWTARKPEEDKTEESAFIRDSNATRILDRTDHVIPDSESRYKAGNRGKKVTADGSIITNSQLSKTYLPLKRSYTAEREVVTIYEESDSCIQDIVELPWRRTHNLPEKELSITLSKTASTSARGDVSCQRNQDATGNRNHFDNLLDNSQTFDMPGSCVETTFSQIDSESRRKTQRHGKRKSGSSSNETSNSDFDVPEVAYMTTYSKPSNSRATRIHNSRLRSIILRPVVEVDDLHSPEASSSNHHEQNQSASDNTDSRASQIESDELLAQQLQEQFYNESLGTGDREEIDEAIARSLQQEENAQHPSLASGQFQHSHHRLNLQEVRTNRSSRTRVAVSNTLHGERDFNEADYEMLLALDDNNHQHTGASEYLINNLPRSIVQIDSIKEPCAVCLEKLSVGETIRHLPCFHKFHKDCIDQWLRRKMSCPVCKSGITISYR